MNVKDLIYDGLCQLVLDEHKDYNELSIAEICDKSGVCRNSFYRNYNSKDEIIINKFFEDYNPTAPVKETMSKQDFIKHIILNIKHNQRLFKLFYLARPDLYYKYISRHIISSNFIKNDNIDKMTYYNVASYSWAILGLISEWINNECDLSIDDMTLLILKLIN